MRPILHIDLSVEEFLDYYWLKAELQEFCRGNGLSAAGSKGEITDRISTFLRTGEIINPIRQATARPKKQQELNLDTVITANHRCSQNVRAFFKTVIPAFHFSTFIQHYFKQNIGKTYRDAVTAWREEEERKKDPSYKRDIAPQFEYNRFIRDYFADPNNKGKSQAEAIKAWDNCKRLPGSRTYHSFSSTVMTEADK
ncbi:hypothetical protein NCCP2222_12460 [Sporosarcina sp. NCCP-2222]|uniref:DUF6434 domain-containing protein n=1 Tax=Sporosarcina sp. NCCP-2222 TaxID=2935073 RepID=UPI002088BEC6|nr:DUF6434 domain-containing protein [Sporosarcina sp. NCCP-2222]GKV55299.1 hypothetical protein NCCP2222_12460 [Sporosarcina sp. NCCP-2222]